MNNLNAPNKQDERKVKPQKLLNLPLKLVRLLNFSVFLPLDILLLSLWEDDNKKDVGIVGSFWAKMSELSDLLEKGLILSINTLDKSSNILLISKKIVIKNKQTERQNKLIFEKPASNKEEEKA
ncbi:hypothetical protein NG798_12320 [Ancylothrix sp. C2]|uniref:hypothetical protein n=1 Tax=Ancylothrix sp. D3o TaxID=2953691 RepID=UPI0021BA6CD5|nr:hypothetical protein [Ancylothrix sp. D3o]MCT7950578.1 hypothetical protein [Ancylothrix sp. D3o]